MKKVRLWAIALFIIISAAALSLAFVTSATPDTPILYKNDTKYTIEEYPAELVNGEVYVPVSFFIGLKNIRYAYATRPAGFYLTNEITKRFFSFSSNAETIVVDSSLVDVSFPILNSTVYLPLEYCADVLSLKIEKINDENGLNIRLCDGSEKLSFDELIELYNPTEIPDVPPIITPENPTEPTNPPEVRTERSLYVTILADKKEYTDKMLDALERHSARATVFFDKDDVTANPEAVIRAFVLGYGIGISVDEPSVEALREANEALYSVINVYTRICTLETGHDENFADLALAEGYLLWSYDFNSDVWHDESAKETARNMYNKTFEQTTTIIRLTSGERDLNVLDRLFYYLSGDDYISLNTINPTTQLDRR